MLTARPPGVTGAIAAYEAARLLHLQRSAARQAGDDAAYEQYRAWLPEVAALPEAFDPAEVAR